jgi:SecD/SecF fusion protein
MRPLITNGLIILTALVLSVWAIYPPEKKLRTGKDLSGGVSLVYAVSIEPGENYNVVLPNVIDVIRDRVDPNGVMNIDFIQQGRDRIEITMPLPNERVRTLKKAFDAEMDALQRGQITVNNLAAALAKSGAERAAALETLAVGSDARRAALAAVAGAYDAMVSAKAALEAQADPAARDALAAEAARTEIEYERARDALIASALTAEEVRRALQASTRERLIEDGNEFVTLPSPRSVALEQLRRDNPDAQTDIDRILAKWEAYAAERIHLDDAQDLVRMLKGSGVMSFRISVNPSGEGSHPQEPTLRRELAELGPTNTRATDVKWCRINRIESWVRSKSVADAIQKDPAAAVPFFAQMGYVVEPYQSEYYMLCWDTSNTRLTPAEGSWAVERAWPGLDNIGRPAIHFAMDPPGAVRLGNLTRQHVGDKMAVLLDDEVYTAPRLKSEISSGGLIEGDFDKEEINYVVRVLGAGSLKGKLSPQPISINSVGPELGADNLRKGLVCGLYSIIIVAGFMVLYYFGSGTIAVFCLAFNSLLILGAMAVSKAAFTMPGIAGVILTFGMAVDSNVLIFERMREEFARGADMKSAVRLGFDRALASIVDGNVTNLIVCVVLYYFGTPEIRGFAITMGIGVVGTLASALYASRWAFDLLVLMGWRRASMLPMAIPSLQKMLTPNVQWLRYRWVFLGISSVYVLLGLFAVFYQSSKMLDTEFLGGTKVTLAFKSDDRGTPVTLKRSEVEQRLRELAASFPKESELRNFEKADVIAIDPRDDGVTSDRFDIKIRTDTATGATVLEALAPRFADVLPDKPALRFEASDRTERHLIPAYLIDRPTLGPCIDQPSVAYDSRPFLGGIAIIARDFTPALPLQELRDRWHATRSTPDYSDTLSRTTDIVILDGDEQAVRSAAFLVRDESVSLSSSDGEWSSRLRDREWSLVQEAFTHAQMPASVQSFSASVASTFRKDAILATIVSFFFIGIYIWVRFKTPRYSIAAVVALVHDVLTVLGLLALAEILYESPATTGFAAAIGLLPFKIDLNTVAALLTIAGYSLNDTVVVMDRIRENRGKLPFATSKIINDSINQTFSRTIITGGSTMGSCVILYVFGGEGMRAFAFCLLTGLIVGTYSSVAVAAPIVWSRKYDRELAAEGGIVAHPA